MTTRKPFVACGVRISPVIGYNKHSGHILGIHGFITEHSCS